MQQKKVVREGNFTATGGLLKNFMNLSMYIVMVESVMPSTLWQRACRDREKHKPMAYTDKTHKLHALTWRMRPSIPWDDTSVRHAIFSSCKMRPCQEQTSTAGRSLPSSIDSVRSLARASVRTSSFEHYGPNENTNMPTSWNVAPFLLREMEASLSWRYYWFVLQLIN